MEILKDLMNALYGTKRKKRKFLKHYPEEIILAADASKGIKTKQSAEISSGIPWIRSQREALILSDKRLQSGKWDIPLNDIKNAELLYLRSLISPFQVLKISTQNGEHFQFAMQRSSDWIQQDVLPLSPENAKLKTSPFSLIVRIVAVAYLLYLLFK